MFSSGLHAVEASHHGSHGAPASPEASPASLTSPGQERVTAETQSPPGVMGIGWPNPVEDNMWFKSMRIEQLEYRMKDDDDDTVRWDAEAWYGADYDRLTLKTEGEWQTTEERGGEAEIQALYSRLVMPFWEAQVGLRFDQRSANDIDHTRGFAVIGIEGIAPYWMEIEAALFISQDGDVSGRLTAAYDLLLTQRLVLQPRVDVDAAVQTVRDFGVGEGLNGIGLGLRLRYEIIREFAPYIGVQYLGRIGETADLARIEGKDDGNFAGVIGVRVIF